MNFRIYSKNLDLTSELKDYISKKIESLEKFLPKRQDLKIAIEVSKTTKHHQHGPFCRAEVNFSLGKNFIRAEAEKENIFLAIDKVKDELQREIKKLKEKKETLKMKNVVIRKG